MTRIRHLLCITLAGIAAAFAAPLAAQAAYPEHAVRLVVPFPPGGPSDILGRVLAEQLSKRWGQSVVVENKPGGLTRIAAMNVMRAQPDGYTLMIGIDATFSMNPYLYREPGYRPLEDFTHITLIATQSLVLLANKGTGISSMQQLIDEARKNPGKINFGSATTSTQLAGEMFKRNAKVDLTYVPYKGNPEVTRAMLANEVQIGFDGIAANVPHIQKGDLVPLATTGLQRTPALPDVPSLNELGMKGYEVRVWNGLSGPAGMPRAIVDKIQQDVKAALAQPEVREKLLTLGLETVGSTPEEYVATINRDAAKYRPLIEELGLRID